MEKYDELEEYRYEKAKRKAKEIRGFYYNLACYCTVIPILIFINLTFVPQFHWFWFSLIGWGTGVLVHGVSAFELNPFLGKNWEEKKIERFIKEQKSNNQESKNNLNTNKMENLDMIEQQKYERAKKRVKSVAGFYKHLMSYIIVNLFLISMKYFKLEPGENFIEFSTFSTAFFWGIGLVFHAAGVFGTNVFLGNDWEEKKINELMNKNQGNKWE